MIFVIVLRISWEENQVGRQNLDSKDGLGPIQELHVRHIRQQKK